MPSCCLHLPQKQSHNGLVQKFPTMFGVASCFIHFKQSHNNMPRGLAFIQIINDQCKYVYTTFIHLEINVNKNCGCSFKLR